MIFGEALNAAARRHVAITRAPESQSINQRLAQNDLFRRLERFNVPHAPVGPGQVHVQRRADSQVVEDLSAIDFRDCPVLIKDRDDKAAI
jgi:hypothetical protein